METKNKQRLKVPGALIVFCVSALTLSAAGITASRVFGGFSEWYAGNVYHRLVGSVGAFFGLLPFSVGELIIYGLAAAAAVWIVLLLRSIRRKNGGFLKTLNAFGRVVLAVVSAIALLFTFNCGINYQRTPFSELYGYATTMSSKEELIALCESLTVKTNAAADSYYPKDGSMPATNSFDMAKKGREAMNRLAERFPALKGYYPPAKPVLFSRGLSYLNLLGIYFPPTIEANFNRDVLPYEQASSVCHELSHLSGFMLEDEANFIAYLACVGSGEPEFVYSGYMMSLNHSMNALASADYDEFLRIAKSYDKRVLSDFAKSGEYWRQFEGPVATVSNAVNDTYLKVNAQPDGVRSYGRVVDLLLAEHRLKS